MDIWDSTRLFGGMSNPIYAIPDIHGQRAMLEEALARIDHDGGRDAKVVFLGDYVDRGPDSRGVIELLMEGQAAGRNWTILRGNHDQLFLDFLDTGKIHNARFSNPDYTWLHERLGGAATLASYGVLASEARPNHAEATAAVPDAHRAWLSGLPYYLELGELLFVHAGIIPDLPLGHQPHEDLIWIRGTFLDHPAPHPWLVVHGHTALKRPQHFGNRIDLDGGAGWGRPLCPAVFEGRNCWLLTASGRVALPAP
ncbi:metallophosphoesterase family protein [Roseovarius sp. MMSF_3359]|uniref:metallophosphoesterase family protein n=2 Tax=unclassified Roseovarius TaxID=2614913 RepID=UPI0035323A32